MLSVDNKGFVNDARVTYILVSIGGICHQDNVGPLREGFSANTTPQLVAERRHPSRPDGVRHARVEEWGETT